MVGVPNQAALAMYVVVISNLGPAQYSPALVEVDVVGATLHRDEAAPLVLVPS